MMMAVETQQHIGAREANLNDLYQDESNVESASEFDQGWEDQTAKMATLDDAREETVRRSNVDECMPRENSASPREVGKPTSTSRTGKYGDVVMARSMTEEQQWFQNFMQKLEALEKRNQEMVTAKDDDYELHSQHTEAALVQAENKFQEYRAALQELPKDNDRIDQNIKELDSLQERVEELIARQGWEEQDNEQRHGVYGPYLQEIAAVDASDEMSEVTYDSHCQSISDSLMLEPKPLLPYLPAWKQSSASAEPTVQTEDTSDLFMSFLDDNEDESNACDVLMKEDSMPFGDSDLLHDAEFMRQNGKDLLVAPAPLIKPPKTEDNDSHDVFCFPKKQKNDDQECQFCVIQ